jgi:hypothetical protein
MDADSETDLGGVHLANGKHSDRQRIEHGVTQDRSQRDILSAHGGDRERAAVDVDRVMRMLVPDRPSYSDQRSKSFPCDERLDGNLLIVARDCFVLPHRSLNQSRDEGVDRGVLGRQCSDKYDGQFKNIAVDARIRPTGARRERRNGDVATVGRRVRGHCVGRSLPRRLIDCDDRCANGLSRTSEPRIARDDRQKMLAEGQCPTATCKFAPPAPAMHSVMHPPVQPVANFTVRQGDRPDGAGKGDHVARISVEQR